MKRIVMALVLCLVFCLLGGCYVSPRFVQKGPFAPNQTSFSGKQHAQFWRLGPEAYKRHGRFWNRDDPDYEVREYRPPVHYVQWTPPVVHKHKKKPAHRSASRHEHRR